MRLLPGAVAFQRGVVRSFVGGGFGFIKRQTSDEDSDDLWFHASALPASQRDIIEAGLAVEYA
jgi:cold shock CspA family protein